MEVIDLLQQIDDSDHSEYDSFIKKWLEYAKGSKQPSTKDWEEFFKQTNPVAGIDRASLKDVATIRNKGEIQTNERQTFINSWGIISKKIIGIVSGDDATMIKQLRDLRDFLVNLIHNKGGRKMVVAINRVLVTFFPDFFIPIPDEKKVKRFIDLINEYINGVHIENTDDWVNNNHSLKQYLDGVPEARNKDAWKILDKLEEYHNKRQKMTIETTKLLENNYNLILTGAPGTGKTYLAREIAATMIGCVNKDLKDNEQFGFVQIHPSYDYTDFVEGLRPMLSGGFQRIDGTFKAFCKTAAENEGKNDKKFVFVIDEINRGEISKIFGELFFSIEQDYRGKEKGLVKTQYQKMIDEDNKLTEENYPFKTGFYVPTNVYIIGTMNDIDRSVESMDFALRRRFAFKEIFATDTQESILNVIDASLQPIAKNKMNAINDAIYKESAPKSDKINILEGFSAAYHIGASYFKNIEKYKTDVDPWDKLWNYHIKGVLFEYLRGNPDAAMLLTKLEKIYKDA